MHIHFFFAFLYATVPRMDVILSQIETTVSASRPWIEYRCFSVLRKVELNERAGTGMEVPDTSLVWSSGQPGREANMREKK